MSFFPLTPRARWGDNPAPDNNCIPILPSLQPSDRDIRPTPKFHRIISYIYIYIYVNNKQIRYDKIIKSKKKNNDKAATPSAYAF